MTLKFANRWMRVPIAFGILFLGLSTQALTIGSNDIAAGKTISNEYVFNGMGCSGKNISPEVHWADAPKETKSFALTVYDPAAPTGSGFWHWIVYNIPATSKGFEKGWKSSAETGTEIANDYGIAHFGGPCPPPGKPHPYIFTIHALNTEKLDLPAGATNAVARFMIEGATIKKENFKAYYGR